MGFLEDRWGPFSIALSSVVVNKFAVEELMYRIRQRPELLFSIGFFHDGSRAMSDDLPMGNNQIIDCAKLIFDSTVDDAIDTNNRDIELGTGTVNGNVSPGRAYYFGQLAVVDTWYPMVGADATGLDWRGVRVGVNSTYDTTDPGVWVPPGASSFGGGVLTSGVAYEILQTGGGIHALEVRSNSSTGNLEVRRTGTNNNYNYVTVWYVNAS